jgi:hypothetical protein
MRAILILLLLALALASACCGSAFGQSDLRKLDANIDRLCAGLFWSVNQCGAVEFRDAHGRAFLQMARKAAALEGKSMPLTQDEAAAQMSDELREWLNAIGPACETFQQLPKSVFGELVNLDMCVRRLRGGQ